MRQLILNEVRQFRHSVRAPQSMSYSNQQMANQTQVPIPEGYDPRAYEDPRPQEMIARGQGLEGELAGGLDASHNMR